MLIHPYYRDNEGWMFDDPTTGLVQEGLVLGIDTILDLVCNERGLNKHRGFPVEFSDKEFPDFEYRLVKIEEVNGNHNLYGTDYLCEEYGIQGWLCPNLGKYFENPPEEIFLRVVAT